jgi:hypothetical protein
MAPSVVMNRRISVTVLMSPQAHTKTDPVALRRDDTNRIAERMAHFLGAGGSHLAEALDSCAVGFVILNSPPLAEPLSDGALPPASP